MELGRVGGEMTGTILTQCLFAFSGETEHSELLACVCVCVCVEGGWVCVVLDAKKSYMKLYKISRAPIKFIYEHRTA